MKSLFLKKLLLLCAIMIMLSFLGFGIVLISENAQKAQNEKKESSAMIVTSFDPIYVAALNLVDSIEGVQIQNLTENHTGCLHDYQITTKDKKVLDAADIFLLNGADMEHIFEDVIASYQELTVIDSSEGISLLSSSGQHDHQDMNGHIWMNPEYYRQQLQTISKALQQFDPKHKSQYKANLEFYDQKVQKLQEEMTLLTKKLNGKEIVIFHEAFAYLAQALGLTVIYTLDMDEETSFRAGEVAQVIDKIRLYNVEYLWVEEQFTNSIARSIAEETGAKLVILSTLTNESSKEEIPKEAYLNGMKRNLEKIQIEMKAGE